MLGKIKNILMTTVLGVSLVGLSGCTAVAEFFEGKYETNTHELSEAFSAIAIDSDTADIELIYSENGESKVVCYQKEKANCEVVVIDGTLTAKAKSSPMNLFGDKSKITVYLPSVEYTALIVKADTGDIVVPSNFTFESVDISADTGDITLNASASGAIKVRTSTGNISVGCEAVDSLDLSISTGKISVRGVTVAKECKIQADTGNVTLSDSTAEKLSVTTDTGKVTLSACDADELYITTETGNVTGTLLTDKVFIVRTSTGDIDVPKTITGGRCEITTDTGDIKISVQAK